MLGPINEPRYQGYAEDIHSSGKHLLSIINDVLDLAKVETGKMDLTIKEFDAVDVAKEVAKLLAAQAKADQVSLTVKSAGPSLKMHSDKAKVRQILLNLVSNAVKFTGEGGEVIVRIDGNARGDRMAMVVADTGIGMKRSDIPAALAPFSQIDSSLARRHEGTGLGLPLSSRLAQLLGGSLTIDSTPNVGTTVTVRLPVRVNTEPGPRLSSAA